MTGTRATRGQISKCMMSSKGDRFVKVNTLMAKLVIEK